jgi:hypothetical protein
MSTMSLALYRKKEDRVREILQNSLSWVVSDAETAVAEVHKYQTVGQWRTSLNTRISMVAFGAGVIPGLSAGGLILELPYLFHLMGTGAIGIGELAGAKIEAEPDLMAIFGLWSGAVNEGALAAAEGGVVVANTIAYPAFGAKVLALGLELGTKAVASSIGGMAGATVANASLPLGPMIEPTLAKVSAKVSVKVSAKVGAKAVLGFVPVFGAAVNIGISLYILDEFLNAAEKYYQHKIKDAASAN